MNSKSNPGAFCISIISVQLMIKIFELFNLVFPFLFLMLSEPVSFRY